MGYLAILIYMLNLFLAERFTKFPFSFTGSGLRCSKEVKN